MKHQTKAALGALAVAAGLAAAPATALQGPNGVRHVLLISIDGMHALDFHNCANGMGGVNGGKPYCPNLAAMAVSGFTYNVASTSRPSDSFPGFLSLITGGSPRSTGTFYDVSYDRALSPPALTTPYGIFGGADLCPSKVGTQVGYDEEIDVDYTQLDAGGGVNANYLPRDPARGCIPVYPHTFIQMNTIFEVVKFAGGYTAWEDKHPSYEMVRGPSGQGINDFWGPEINSIPVALPQLKRVNSVACKPLPDQTTVASSNAWTDSFANIKCYDALKVQGILNEIDGLDHSGAAKTQVPTLFGMNFQAVSVGEKLVENSIGLTGGYIDNHGSPSSSLLGEIQFVDAAIGQMVSELRAKGLYDSTTIVVTAKHGQSPIDPKSVLRIPADNISLKPPSSFLPTNVQADEDDVSLLWLKDRSPAGVASAVATLEANRATIGADGGEILSGPQLALLFNVHDSRSPDVVVTPKVGVTYTGHQAKVAEHGGFAEDDTNVMMLVSAPTLGERTFTTRVSTAQVAPTIVKLLGLDPAQLEAVRREGTEILPGF